MEIDNNLADEFRSFGENEIAIRKKCAKICEDIKQGIYSIVYLVEQLKSLLIDTSPNGRQLGMSALSQVLELLSPEHLNAEQLNFIFVFYADRLNDHHQVIPAALTGVLALLKFQNIPKGAVSKALNSLFQNVPCQQQQHADRNNIYKILETSLDKHYFDVKEMGYDFVYGVISAMDGERDPRNLLFLFNWLPNFLKRFHLGHLTEEMFEVMACYFPVDFRAPPQDPNTITRETLAQALCKCLCALPEFSEYCLPLALEKLTSTLQIAKLDSLDILSEGCKTFAASQYIQHSTDIWSQIQREVLSSTDKEVSGAALKALEAVIAKLSENEASERIFQDIIDTLKGNLSPHMKLFLPSCKMLYHMAKASKPSANFVISQIMPLLINTYNISTSPSLQVLVFNRLIDFTCVYLEVDDQLSEHLSEVPALCLKVIMSKEEEVRAAGLKGLALIAKSVPLDVRKCFYEDLRVLLISPQGKSVREGVLSCVKVFSHYYQVEIQSLVLDNIKINGNNSLKLYLEALSVIVDYDDFTSTVLMSFIEYCLKDATTAQIATECLGQLLEEHKENAKIQEFLLNESIIDKLHEWVLNHINELNTHHKLLLESISSIYTSIIGYQENEVQSCIINNKLQPLLNLYKTGHAVLLIILKGLLIRLRRGVLTVDLTDELLTPALTLKDEYLRHISWELLANILNKTEDEKLDSDLTKIECRCNDDLRSTETADNALAVLSWTTKALVMRGHPKADYFTDKLLELLDEHKQVAKGLHIIMDDSFASCGAESYCSRRVLYRQKFFNQVSTKLAERYTTENTNCLLAIGCLIQAAPKQAFIAQLGKILTLVLLCLEECQDSSVLCVILETVCELIQERESALEEHVHDFLPRILKLTTFEASMQVRINALCCIKHYTEGCSMYKLLLFKQEVVQKLSQCLDDRKRLVRKEAVQARLRWFLLDAPI